MNAVEPIRDKDDIQAMKDYLRSWNERNYILFLVGINTGFRIGDILKLRVKDVQGWHIRVREQKTGKQKNIKMTRTLKNELRKYVEGKPLHHYLFQSRNGVNKPLDRRTVYWILKTAGNDLGIENIGTHTMRKTLILYFTPYPVEIFSNDWEPSKGTFSKSGTVRQKGGKNFVEFMTRDFFYIPPDLEC